MSEKQRTTIWLSDSIRKTIDNYKNVSNRLAKVCDRYLRIIELTNTLERFTHQEFLFLCDEFNGTIWESATQIRPLYIYCETEKDVEAKENHWKIDISDLQRRLNDLTLIETISLIDLIEFFWTPKQVKKDADWAEILTECGFKFKDF